MKKLLLVLTIFSSSLWAEPAMVAQMNKEENFYLKHHQLKNALKKKNILEKKIRVLSKKSPTSKKLKFYKKQYATLLFWEKLFKLNAKEIPLLLERDRSSEKYLVKKKLSQEKKTLKTEIYTKITGSPYRFDSTKAKVFYQKNFKKKKK